MTFDSCLFMSASFYVKKVCREVFPWYNSAMIYLQGCSNIKSNTLERPCAQLFVHFIAKLLRPVNIKF